MFIHAHWKPFFPFWQNKHPRLHFVLSGTKGNCSNWPDFCLQALSVLDTSSTICSPDWLCVSDPPQKLQCTFKSWMNTTCKSLVKTSPLFLQFQHCSALLWGLAMQSCRLCTVMQRSSQSHEGNAGEPEAEKHNYFPTAPWVSVSRSRRGTLPPCGNGPSLTETLKSCRESASSLSCLSLAVLLTHQQAKSASALCWSRVLWI